MTATAPGPIIAIIGSDGSGKSTVGEALAAWIGARRPAALCHLGKKTGDVGRALRRMPVVGGGIDRTLVRHADSTRAEAGPGLLTALVTYRLSMRRVRKFRRMLRLRAAGTVIVADRYPQVAVPGPKMDGVHFTAARPRNPLVRRLARRERRLYAWMAGHVPDLVIRLNVDLATAAARKPDHRYSSLAQKVAIVPRLSFGGAPIVELDATEPLEAVLAQAKAAVAEVLGFD